MKERPPKSFLTSPEKKALVEMSSAVLAVHAAAGRRPTLLSFHWASLALWLTAARRNAS